MESLGHRRQQLFFELRGSNDISRGKTESRPLVRNCKKSFAKISGSRTRRNPITHTGLLPGAVLNARKRMMRARPLLESAFYSGCTLCWESLSSAFRNALGLSAAPLFAQRLLLFRQHQRAHEFRIWLVSRFEKYLWRYKRSSPSMRTNLVRLSAQSARNSLSQFRHRVINADYNDQMANSNTNSHI